jgi:hypothetical protein
VARGWLRKTVGIGFSASAASKTRQNHAEKQNDAEIRRRRPALGGD